MATPFYCTDCDSLLGSVDFDTAKMYCSKCNKPSELPADKTVLVIASTSLGRNRELTKEEITRLSDLPTTSSMNEKCANCNFPITNLLHDTDYHFKSVCPKCNTIFVR
jgi:Zn finger protein HypA/HybF involved in hydrogenase expression